MSGSDFTPGPWVVEKCTCGHPNCRKYGTSNGLFFQGNGYSQEDAHLISSAPELHEALELILNVARLTPGFSGMVIKQAESALAKARGEGGAA